MRRELTARYEASVRGLIALMQARTSMAAQQKAAAAALLSSGGFQSGGFQSGGFQVGLPSNPSSQPACTARLILLAIKFLILLHCCLFFLNFLFCWQQWLAEFVRTPACIVSLIACCNRSRLSQGALIKQHASVLRRPTSAVVSCARERWY